MGAKPLSEPMFTRTNADLLSIGPFGEIRIIESKSKYKTFHSIMMHLKICKYRLGNTGHFVGGGGGGGGGGVIQYVV